MCAQAGVHFALILLLLTSFGVTFATGTTCEEIPLEICATLPYTSTGFPNSLGHASSDQIPPTLNGALRTLIALGCYDHVQLFLCAAAFPQCTASGTLLPPCRALCETAVSKCSFWFSLYSDLNAVNCELLPNSSNSNICVGLDTSPSPVQSETFSENTTAPLTTERIEVTSNEKITPENPFPWKPVTESLDETGSFNTEKEKRLGSSTVLDLHAISPELTSEFIVQRSTDSKGIRKIVDIVEKSVKTNNNMQGDTNNLSVPPVLGITLSVLSCGGMVILLISCAFFRKVFGKPFSGSRKPRDGAFYTNPAFSDIPQSSQNGQYFARDQAYTLDDLPPHPASGDVRPKSPTHTQLNIYQQEPTGFIEQNLFTVPLSPNDHHGGKRHASQTGPAHKTSPTPKGVGKNNGTVSNEFVFSNNATNGGVDTNANEQRATTAASSDDNRSCLAPSMDEPFPRVSTNMDDGDMVIANPVAC